MVVRIAILASVVVALLALSHSVRAHDRCQDGLRLVLASALGNGAPGGEARGITAIRASCRDASSLVAVASVLHAQKRDAQALAFAQEAARRAPEDARAWSAIAVTAQTRAPRTALRAAQRFAALSPLDRPPVSTAALARRIAG